MAIEPGQDLFPEQRVSSVCLKGFLIATLMCAPFHAASNADCIHDARGSSAEPS
jgi:hypothetical protein